MILKDDLVAICREAFGPYPFTPMTLYAACDMRADWRRIMRAILSDYDNEIRATRKLHAELRNCQPEVEPAGFVMWRVPMRDKISRRLWRVNVPERDRTERSRAAFEDAEPWISALRAALGEKFEGCIRTSDARKIVAAPSFPWTMIERRRLGFALRHLGFHRARTWINAYDRITGDTRGSHWVYVRGHRGTKYRPIVVHRDPIDDSITLVRPPRGKVGRPRKTQRNPNIQSPKKVAKVAKVAKKPPKRL